jgi:hypothetical protein
MKKLDDKKLAIVAVDSSKNEEDLAVAFSINLADTLSHKFKEHNKENSKSKTTLQQLKKVYIQGANNHRAAKDPNGSLNLWGLARVNMYLGYKAGNGISMELEKPKSSKISSLTFESQNKKTSINYFLDVTEEWKPSKEDFEKAGEDIKKYNLDYSFSSLEDIYLEYKQVELQWE